MGGDNYNTIDQENGGDGDDSDYNNPRGAGL